MKVFLCQEILGKRYSSLPSSFYAETGAQRNSNKLMPNTHSMCKAQVRVLKLSVVIFTAYYKLVNKKLLKYLLAYSYKNIHLNVSLSPATSGDDPVDAGLPCHEVLYSGTRYNGRSIFFNSISGKSVLCGIRLMTIRYLWLGMATKINQIVNKHTHE
jgi:hypothetical protein